MRRGEGEVSMHEMWHEGVGGTREMTLGEVHMVGSRWEDTSPHRRAPSLAHLGRQRTTIGWEDSQRQSRPGAPGTKAPYVSLELASKSPDARPGPLGSSKMSSFSRHACFC